MALAGPAGLLAALCAAPASSIADSSLRSGASPIADPPGARSCSSIAAGSGSGPFWTDPGCVLRWRSQVGVAAVEPAGDRGVASVRRELRGNPAVAGVEPGTAAQRLIPDDPAYSAPDPRRRTRTPTSGIYATSAFRGPGIAPPAPARDSR